MSLRESSYRLLIHGLRAISPVLSRGDSKLARGIRGRRDAARILVRWGRKHRNPARPLAWFHAPSVGEGFQARATMEALRELRPDVQLVYTYFSPSAEAFADRIPADEAGFLPWDLPPELRPVLHALAPDLLAFTKTEVWPVLAREASRRGIPLSLIAATLPAGAGRLRPPARWFLRPTFARLSRVAAIAADDADRFSGIGLSPDRVVVTGDPGIDSAAARAEDVDPDAPYLRPFRSGDRPTVVAGSTWPPDEEVLLPAVARVREDLPGLRLVIAPHEPHRDHLDRLASALEGAGWRVGFLGSVESAGSCRGIDAVVVDRVGVLAQLYTIGSAAYVGGGFHDDGLHSVLEPAAAGIPVAFGPGNENARAATDLLAMGGGVEVRSEDDLVRALLSWLSGRDEGRRAGRLARGYIERHRGAARRTAELLEEMLPER